MFIELFFFPLLFPSYCRSADPRVVSIVSGSCNQSSSALFYVVFKSLYRCINAVFNAGKSSSYFFPWHISRMPYAWSLVFLFSGPFVWVFLCSTSRIVTSILRRRQPRYLLLLLLLLFLASFSLQSWLVIFHWGLSDKKSSQVSRTL